MPLSVVRWIRFTGGDPSPVATFTAGIILSMGGVMNAVLYRLTRAEFFERDGKRAIVAPTTLRMAPIASEELLNQ